MNQNLEIICKALLEHQFERELEIPRIAGSSCLSKGGIVDRIVSDLEIGVVQDIEGLGAEFKLQRLGELEVFQNGNVGRPVSRSNERVSSQVPNAGQAWRSEEIGR